MVKFRLWPSLIVDRPVYYKLQESEPQGGAQLKVIIVSDVHSNLEAFESVLGDAESRGRVDKVWSLGDLVGYGPDPGPCVDLLRRYDHVAIAGNHDLACIGKLSIEAFNPHAAAANLWTGTQLTKEQTAYLGTLPLKLEMDQFTLAHGSPRDPIWEYVVSEAAASSTFIHFDTYRCLVGHSHIPFICRPSEEGAVYTGFALDAPVTLGTDRMIINPGGVGQPRDGDPRASYAIYDSEEGTIVHHRAEYDIPKTQEKMDSHALPEFLSKRLTYGR